MGTVTIERPRPVPRPVVKRSAAELSAIDVLPTSEATILVVDHHRSFADVLAQALKRGCRDAMRARRRPNRKESLPGQSQPDIVVLDVQMRGQDRARAIHASVRQPAPNTAVAVVTANRKPVWSSRAAQAAASAFILRTDQSWR